MQVPSQPLHRHFYSRPPDVVARELIGKAVVRTIDGVPRGGLIVETEAYLSAGDEASHSHRGPTSRNRSMFQAAGTLYVYSIHNKFCLNTVTESIGVGSAVLIRAVEPVWDLPAMMVARNRTDRRELCRGPGMLCQVFHVDRKLDGSDLCDGEDLFVADTTLDLPIQIQTGPRIGIRLSAELPLRFFADGNRYVSGRAKDHGQPVKHSFLAN